MQKLITSLTGLLQCHDEDLVVKGHCEPTNHIFVHHTRIYKIIMTTFTQMPRTKLGNDDMVCKVLIVFEMIIIYLFIYLSLLRPK